MFSFWHIKLDKLAPALSNNNFHPKSNVVEVGVFPPMGYGPWASTVEVFARAVSGA
jgi:putative DNA methylase